MATMTYSTNNPVGGRNVYGAFNGPSISATAGPMNINDNNPNLSEAAATDANGNVVASGTAAAAGSAATKGFLGQPFTWFLVLIALLIGLKFIAQKFGEGEDFKSIRVSMHNVIIISIAAIIGIGFFKVILNRWKVPGLTTYVNAV